MNVSEFKTVIDTDQLPSKGFYHFLLSKVYENTPSFLSLSPIVILKLFKVALQAKVSFLCLLCISLIMGMNMFLYVYKNLYFFFHKLSILVYGVK